MNKKFIIVIITLISSLLTVIAACNVSNSSGSGDIRIRGRLSEEFLSGRIEKTGMTEKSISSAVSHIGAFHVVTDGLNAGDPEADITEVEADGSFELSVDNEQDRILMLVNRNSDDPRGTCVGFAVLQGDKYTLVNMPLASSLGDIELGKLTKAGNEAVSELSYLDADEVFSMSPEQLDELAATDNLFKAIMNSYINYDPVAQTSYRTAIRFDWYSEMVPGSFLSPESYEYSGYGISIATNHVSRFTFDEIVDKSVILELVPPGEVNSATGSTYGPENPLDTADVVKTEGTGVTGYIEEYEVVDDDFAIWYYPDGAYYYDKAYYLLGIAGPGASITDNYVPDGYWTLKLKEGEELAVFDFSVSSPLGQSGKPIIPIPLWKVNEDPATHRVTSIEIRFVRYDETTSSYIELTDLSVLNRISASTLNIQIDDFTGTTSNSERINEAFFFDDLSPITEFQHAWYTSASGRTDVPVIELVNVSYSVGMSWFFFAS